MCAIVKNIVLCSAAVALLVAGAGIGNAADVVPTDIQQPGTQPGEVGNLESPTKCDNCHGNRSKGVQLAPQWAGSMMAHAGRDPIFWATLAVAEQDFDGSGDLCLRCHATAGWLAGRSTPTDGSSLGPGDSDGVECHYCHALTKPDNSEYVGVMNPPYIANDGGNPPTAYLGSGMGSLWGTNEKLGPYTVINPPHGYLPSQFHRDVDFCGTCHDVSNPAVGDLAHNHGTLDGAPPVVASGIPGSPVAGKAAFNNFPYQYGIVERTFSEYKSGQLVQTLVSDYGSLPSDLRAGIIEEARNAATVGGTTSGNYEDGAPRYFSCQTCHMPASTGIGCDKNGVPIRTDLPRHDLVGGNYWMPYAIQYLDSVGKLRLGGGMTTTQINDMLAGADRAGHLLGIAATLEADPLPNTVKITNLSGHKLISGYPEGRRMWLQVAWYDDQDALLRVDGNYGPLVDGNGQPVTVINPADGQPVQVRSILDLEDPNTKIYETHYGLTEEWADQLLALGVPGTLAISYDRYTGAPDYTLADLGAAPAGTKHESFHFVLNNTVVSDNRIPTWGMRYDDAYERNALPVPADQYGAPGPGGVYDYFDRVTFSPPVGAVRGEVRLLYQTTSWEYIQFLDKANDGGDAFLADEGANMLEAWLETGMSEPYEMASATIVPEPGMVATLAVGAVWLGWLGRRRNRGPLRG